MNCTIGAETRHLFDKHNTLKAIVRYLPWCLLKVSVLYFTFDQTKCTYICNSLQVTKPVPLFHWHSIGWFFFSSSSSFYFIQNAADFVYFHFLNIIERFIKLPIYFPSSRWANAHRMILGLKRAENVKLLRIEIIMKQKHRYIEVANVLKGKSRKIIHINYDEVHEILTV